MGRVALKKLTKASVFRKMAMGTWRTVGDPSVYGLIQIDMTQSLKFMESYSQVHGVKITPTHLVGKALAYVLDRRPELNGMIRGNHIYQRENVSLFFQVSIPGKDGDAGDADLAGCSIHGAEKLSLAMLAQQIALQSQKVVSRTETSLHGATRTVKFLPWWMVRFYLNLGSWLIYGLNLNLSFLGLPKDPFGSVMITSVGSFGIDYAWAPLVPYSRVPLLVTVGAIKDQALVVAGQIVSRPVMNLGITFDHRFMDGVHGAQMSRELKACFDQPEQFLV